MPDTFRPRKRGRPPKVAPVPDVVAVTESPVPAQAVEVPDAEFSVDHDPWGEQDFMAIRKHPDGFVLRWCNPNYRQGGKWRGWEPIGWSSEIGRNLPEYLIDPPHRFQGGNQIDDLIRVGNDLVLCKLPIGAYRARMKAKQDKRDRIMNNLTGAKVVDPDAPDLTAEYEKHGPRPLPGMIPSKR